MPDKDERSTGTLDTESGTAEDADTSSDVDAVGSDGDAEQDVDKLRAQLEKERNERKRLLSERTKVEEERARLVQLEAENAALKGNNRQTNEPNNVQEQSAKMLREIEALRQSDNPTAQAVGNAIMASLQLADKNAREFEHKIAISQIPDAEDRKKVDDMVRGGKANYDTAVMLVTMERRLKELEVKKPKTDVVDDEDELENKRAIKSSIPQTVSRPVTGTEASGVKVWKNRQAFLNELNKIDADSPDGFREKQEFLRKNKPPSG